MTKSRIASAVLGLALVASFAAPAEAQTVAQLQAQIQALMAQLAALSGGSVSTGANFSQNLTVGSTGSQVVALQQMLVAQGHLTMPAGVAFGYFGPATKAAVIKWQMANGVSPASGYFGPLSRAKANASGGTTVGGTVGGGAVAGGGTISTPGVEGTLTATLAPVPGAGQTLREGDDKKAVLGVELEAKLSDIKIERIKIKLDQASGGTADRDFYREIADRLYVMSGSTVLASVDLNASTVVEETTGNYYVTVAGLNYIVPKDSERTLTIALDAQEGFDSSEISDTWTVTIPTEGIRGVDGAGVNQYAPSSGTLSRTFTSAADEAESASLSVALSPSSPDAREVIAAAGADEDSVDGVELLKFTARAEDDTVEVTDVVVVITRGGANTATATTAYLYDGSTLVGSASVVGTSATAMTATFDDVSVNVGDGATKTFSVKADFDDATTAATTFSASVTGSSGITAENSEDDSVTPSGSASGETLTVRSVGPEFTLVSKSITKGATPESGNQSTSTATANFTLSIKAVGGDILFGTTASTTPMVTNAGHGGDDGPSFQIYLNGSATTLDVASSTSYTVPSGVVEASNTWTLSEGQTVEVPVTFLFEGRDDDSGAAVATGSYAVGMAQINWVSSAGLQESNFMAGETAWRTSSITLP